MNKKVVVTGFIIIGGGVLNIWLGTSPKGATITRTIIGGFVLVLLLSLLDMFGGPMSTLAGALAMLAAVYVIVTTYLPLLTKAYSATKGS